jgi:hypothetical protein
MAHPTSAPRPAVGLGLGPAAATAAGDAPSATRRFLNALVFLNALGALGSSSLR